MTTEPPANLQSNMAREDAPQSQLDLSATEVCEAQVSLTRAQQHCRELLLRDLIARCARLRIVVARGLRGPVSQFLGWRWAIVLLGAFLAGGVLYVLGLSAISGILSMALTAAILSFFLYVPSDSRLDSIAGDLKTVGDQLCRDRHEAREKLLVAQQRLATATKTLGELRRQRDEYRRSRQFRLQGLAARNWKAMRGGDLEAFLEEVFSELQYAVERTGGAGDQGVDLIVRKDGHRIALQVKGYVESVPNTAIQEAFTGMAYYNCDACAVVTNSRFTAGGKSIARTVGCTLIDEHSLPMLITDKIDLWQDTLKARSQSQAKVGTNRNTVST